MFAQRTSSIRGGIRKPKPRRHAGGGFCRRWSPVACGHILGYLVIGCLGPLGILSANDGVSFNVPATVQCLPLRDAELPAAPAPAAISASHLPSVRLASHRTQETRFVLLALDVTVIFAEPGRYDSVMFEVVPLSRRAAVVDYAPRTQATSDWVGEIMQESVQNRNQNLDSNWSLGLPGYGQGGLQFNRLNSENTVSRQSLKAPVTAVVTSGISQRGRGVFFRYHTTRESIIEGGQQLQLVLEVPSDWRGDLLHVHCLAQGAEDRVQRSYLSALTIAGEAETRVLAEQFAAADHRTEQVLARWQVTQRPTGFWADVERKLAGRPSPASATDAVRVRRSLVAATSVEQVAGFTELPATLQTEIRRYLERKRALLSLAGG
jgi:hypothetical protein